MKPAPFDYYDPDTEAEVLELLAQFGEDAKLLAGGQTLGPMLNMRVVAPAVLIDMNRVGSLDHLAHDADGARIGALTRQSDLEDDPETRARQPLIAAALPHIAHRAIRNRGTVGGSLSHADPAAEWGALTLAMDANMRIRRHNAEDRIVAAEDFFSGWLSTAIGCEEVLTEISLGPLPDHSGWCFKEIARRHGDFAIAGVACRLSIEDTIVKDIRLAAIGVGESPRRLRQAEDAIRDEELSRESRRAAAEAAQRETDPMDDIHASAAYRKKVLGVLVAQSLDEAYDMAQRRRLAGQL